MLKLRVFDYVKKQWRWKNVDELSGPQTELVAKSLEITGDPDQNIDLALLQHAPGSESFFSIDRWGNVTIFSGDTFQQAKLTLQDNTPGNAGLISLDTYNGAVLAPEGTAHAIVTIAPKAGHTGNLLRVLATDGITSIFEIRADGSIHIPTGTEIIADLPV